MTGEVVDDLSLRKERKKTGDSHFEPPLEPACLVRIRQHYTAFTREVSKERSHQGKTLGRCNRRR